MSKSTHHVAVAIVRRDGFWLVARRRANVHLGGLWEFPGGKLRDDESAEDAAIRELREECAVDADAIRALPPQTHEYDDRLIVLTPVLCRWIAGEGAALDAEECRWVDSRGLAALEMPPLNAALIQMLVDEARPPHAAGDQRT